MLQGEFTDRALLSDSRGAATSSPSTGRTSRCEACAAIDRAHGARICPPVAALAAAQDRVTEKRLFEQLQIPTTRWQAVELASRSSTRARRRHRPARRAQDPPARLRRQGPGRGAHGRRCGRAPGSSSAAAPLIYEELVPFDCEVSIIGARSRERRDRHLSAVRQRARAGHPAAHARPLRPRARCSAWPQRYLRARAAALPLRRHSDHRVLRARAAA